jgi:murein DD-endopeptidase
MKTFSARLITSRAIALVAAASVLFLGLAGNLRAEAPALSGFPVDLDIPVAPTPVRSGGSLHLFYELHITDFIGKPVELTRLDVFKGDTGSTPLASYQQADLDKRVVQPGADSSATSARMIPGGSRAVVFVELTLKTDADVPRALHHRLTFAYKKSDGSSAEGIVDGALVAVLRSKPIVLKPPMHGDGWIAGDVLSSDGDHRRTLTPINGKVRIPQRFAIDWVQIGKDGKAYHGNPAENASWYGYGADVLAVADGVVAGIKDGIPDNDGNAGPKEKITVETIGGNYVILDLGGGRFCLFAHLKPGSIKVKLGDKVRAGQVLALLGNSGNTTAPHLHLHVTDANSALGAEGLPYVFESFDVAGVVPLPDKLLDEGEAWKPLPDSHAEHHHREMPVNWAVVKFP